MSQAPTIATQNPKTANIAAAAISIVHWIIIGIFIPTILVATKEITAPITIAITKPATGAIIGIFKIVPIVKPAKAEITPTDKDIYPIDGTPVPKP